ncbi:MAG TPA: pyridoxamine 5'-phosphate oxidase family protein [Pseudolysinimonas sp.]|nr:pyridoxamine 5'-phosphate oxidase family protein [Pseudolysinimonas sp.]
MADDEISEDECWLLLRAERIGRFAIESAGGPQIFPVNYVVRDRAIWFRSAPGEKVAQSAAHPRAAFEIDGRDGDEFWSVVVDGAVSILDDSDPHTTEALANLVSLHPSPKHMVVSIAVDRISGRRFRPRHPAGLWGG